jgi:hypothetical protein
MIAERMWLITQRLTCARLSEFGLSNVWWPFRLHAQTDTDEERNSNSETDVDAEKALVAWLNSISSDCT